MASAQTASAKRPPGAAAAAQPAPWGSHLLRGLLLLLLAANLSLYAAQRINLVTADLGRHIKNGEIALSTGEPIQTNYYSYTHPDFPTVNHHWGSGVVFFGVWRAAGFEGLSVLYVLLMLAAVAAVAAVAWQQGGYAGMLLAATLMLPLIGSRAEVRPEGFSYALLGIFLLVLHRYRMGKMRFAWLLAMLLPLQLVWVNLHLFFILGPGLVGLAWLERQWVQPHPAQARQLLITLGATTLVCLVNPAGLEGAIQPFLIFKEYGYMVAENQPVWFMQGRFWEMAQQNLAAAGSRGTAFQEVLRFAWFELASLAVLGMIWRMRRHWRAWFFAGVPVVVFLALAWLVNRTAPLFGLAFVAFMGTFIGLWRNGGQTAPPRRLGWQRLQTFLLGLAGVLLVLGLSWPNRFGSPVQYQSYTQNGRSKRAYANGLGLQTPDGSGAAQFLKRFGIRGPLLNNYDNGGYCIFHLFPQYRVFVDNRPEAYPVRFFDGVYEPMQADQAVWQRVDARYRFNAILFYRHDQTPHAQPFLIRRLRDREHWAPVFVDAYSILFLRRTPANRRVIEHFEPQVRPMLSGNTAE